jgi:transcriptional regulator with GAF, ATPase, and Fis domain
VAGHWILTCPSPVHPRLLLDQCSVGFFDRSAAQPKFLTEAELQRRERDNLVQVLEAANWKISGCDGAAELLGVKPTTLLSRMDKWGLKKPER